MVTYVVVRSGSADLGRRIAERRNVLEDFLEHGDPTSQQKHVLRRMVPQLYAAR